MKHVYLLSFVLFVFNHLQAQFGTIQWEFYTGAPSFGSAAAADVDNDGFYEIVFSTYTNDGKLHCLNSENGSQRWVYDLGGCADVAPIIFDIDNDDTLDVIVNGSCNPTVFCVNGFTGALKWSKPSGGGDSPPTIADMDHDGTWEVLFCSFTGQIKILNAENGTTDKIIQVDPYMNPIETEPTLVDCNHDGNLDIIVGNHYNIDGLWIWAYDYLSEDTLWSNYMSDTSTYNAYHGGAVADLDGDTIPEYVIGSNNGKVRALNVEDGSVYWSRNIPVSCMSPVSIADLSGDGDLEVVIVNNDYITFDERIWVLDGQSGNTEWSYPVNFPSFRGCAIGDINNNGTLDLVSGHYMGDVIAVEPYSGLLWQTNLLAQFPPGLPYFEVDQGPLIADFDHDDTMEVFVVGGYGTYTPDSQNTGKAFLLNAGLGDCPEWLMFRNDPYRSGYLSPADIQQSCSDVLADEEWNDIQKIQIYPNPTTNEFKIELDQPFTYQIFDMLGNVVSETNKKISPDLMIDVSLLRPGLYVVVINSGSKFYSSRLVVN